MDPVFTDIGLWARAGACSELAYILSQSVFPVRSHIMWDRAKVRSAGEITADGMLPFVVEYSMGYSPIGSAFGWLKPVTTFFPQ